jgi:hypothetical protein
VKIPRSLYETYGGNLEKRIAAHRKALEEHALTVGVPAPIEDELVNILARMNEAVEVEDPPPPPPMAEITKVDPNEPPPPPPGGAPTAPPPSSPVLSQRQFFVGMAKKDVITQQEAMAFLTQREIPAMMAQAIQMAVDMELLPEGMTAFDIEASVIAATQYELQHPFTALIAGVLGWTEDELAAFWVFASEL